MIVGCRPSSAEGMARMSHVKFLKDFVHRAARQYVRRICLSEFKDQSFSVHNERPIEYRFALEALADTKPVTVLDVGTGTTSWPHLLRGCGYLVTAIDNVRDYWPGGMVNRHWHVMDVDISMAAQSMHQNYEAITCISVVEHIADHVGAVRNMVALLKPGGHLVLTTPFSYCNPHPNVYKRADALYGSRLPYICRSSSAAELGQWVACGLSLERRELWRLFTGPVWASGERCDWCHVSTEHEKHQLGCFLFRKR